MKADRLRTLETALGWFGLAASPRGLKAVLGPFDTADAVTTEVRDLFGEPLLEIPDGSLDQATEELKRYANGDSVQFDVELDMEGGTPFQRAVWTALQSIPRGQVFTYGQVASLIGRPSAARAVGQAVGANPWGIIVPCHRVVGGDGSLTGFGGGLALKERLLMIEGRDDAPSQRARSESRPQFRRTRRELGLRKPPVEPRPARKSAPDTDHD